MADLASLIGFLDDEEEEEEADGKAVKPKAQTERNAFAALPLSSLRPPTSHAKLSPYFLTNYRDADGRQVFKFRLREPLPLDSPIPNLFKLPTISLSNLITKRPSCPQEFITVGVVSKRLPSKMSATSNLPYQEWVLSNLDGSECKLLLFGEAFKLYEHGLPQALQHPVLCLNTPGVLTGSSNTASLTVHFSKQLVLCGESADYAQCRSCPLATNASVSKFCPVHAEEEMRVCAANRTNLSTMTFSKRRINGHSTIPANVIPAQIAAGSTVVLKPSNKNAKEVVHSLAQKRNLTAGERMVMQALKMKEQSSSSLATTTASAPDLTAQVRHQVANPPPRNVKRTKLGSGLAGRMPTPK